MVFPDRIRTERLVLQRPTTDADVVSEFYQLCSSPEISDVTEYMPWTRHVTRRDTEDFLHDCTRKFEDGTSANYLIRHRGDDRLIGAGSLACEWETYTGTLGCWLHPDYWGRGLSGERAVALIELAFDELGLELVKVGTVDENEKSRQAIEKYMQRVGGGHTGCERLVAGEPWDGRPNDRVYLHHHFSVTADEYAEAELDGEIESIEWK